MKQHDTQHKLPIEQEKNQISGTSWDTQATAVIRQNAPTTSSSSNSARTTRMEEEKSITNKITN